MSYAVTVKFKPHAVNQLKDLEHMRSIRNDVVNKVKDKKELPFIVKSEGGFEFMLAKTKHSKGMFGGLEEVIYQQITK